MQKKPTESDNVVRCQKSGILINNTCEPGECDTCGWNPVVNARRRQEIQWYAKNKILHLWGAKKQKDATPSAEEINEPVEG